MLHSGVVVLVACLGRTPLFVVGDTAITDHVFLWGVDGLSVWNRDPTAEWMGRVQLAAFALLVVRAALALFVRRGRAVLGLLAGASAMVGAAAGCLHAAWIAPSPRAVIALPGGMALLAALTILLLSCVILPKELRE